MTDRVSTEGKRRRPAHPPQVCVYCGKNRATQRLPNGWAHILCIPVEIRQAAVTTKQCAFCKKMLPREHFHTHPTSHDGLYHRCKECTNVGTRKPMSLTHMTYYGMRERCRDGHKHKWRHYGGRGIKVCERWLGRDGFRNFLADMGEKPPGLTLDRIDSNADYSPENCRWATVIEQARNRRTTLMYTGFGKTQSLPDWCDEYGINLEMVRRRIKRYGWTLDAALTTPAKVRR